LRGLTSRRSERALTVDAQGVYCHFVSIDELAASGEVGIDAPEVFIITTKVKLE